MFDNLVESAIEFNHRRKDVALSALFDFLFFFVYGIVTYIILDRIREHALNAFNIIQQNAEIVKNAKVDLFSIMSTLPGFDASFNQVLFWLGILIVSVYLVYSSLQYFSWRFIAKNKSMSFFKSFTLLSLGWTAVYFIIDFFKNAKSFFFMMQNLPETKTILFTVLFFILAYLAFISYAAIGMKSKKKFKTLRLAFRIDLIYSLLELASLFFLLDILIRVLNIIYPYLALAVGAILLLALMSFSKLHIFQTVRKQKI